MSDFADFADFDVVSPSSAASRGSGTDSPPPRLSDVPPPDAAVPLVAPVAAKAADPLAEFDPLAAPVAAPVPAAAASGATSPTSAAAAAASAAAAAAAAAPAVDAAAAEVAATSPQPQQQADAADDLRSEASSPVQYVSKFPANHPLAQPFSVRPQLATSSSSSALSSGRSSASRDLTAPMRSDLARPFGDTSEAAESGAAPIINISNSRDPKALWVSMRGFPTLHASYIKKEGDGVHRFRKRWAVLKSGVLFYFRSKTDVDPTGFIQVTKDCAIQATDELGLEMFSPLGVSDKVHENRTYVLRWDTLLDRQMWLKAIHVAVPSWASARAPPTLEAQALKLDASMVAHIEKMTATEVPDEIQHQPPDMHLTAADAAVAALPSKIERLAPKYHELPEVLYRRLTDSREWFAKLAAVSPFMAGKVKRRTSGFVRRFPKRYAVLKVGSLFLFRNEKETAPEVAIRINHQCAIELLDDAQHHGIELTSPLAFVEGKRYENETFVLAWDTFDLRQKWVVAIHKALPLVRKTDEQLEDEYDQRIVAEAAAEREAAAAAATAAVTSDRRARASTASSSAKPTAAGNSSFSQPFVVRKYQD